MKAIISSYAHSRDAELPVCTETVRLRMDGSQSDLRAGDKVVLNEMEFTVNKCRHFAGACRVVADAFRVFLDTSRAVQFEHYVVDPVSGTTAHEPLKHVNQIMGALLHDSQNYVVRHDSRQTVGRFRVFLSSEDAAKLSLSSVIKHGETAYKIAGIYDLDVQGKVPYALAEVTEATFAQ